MHNNKGESLVEVIIAATVGVLVVTALTFATIFSLRNANFAKNSAQATKLAQEGIEMVRTLRDRDGDVSYTDVSKFSDLWAITFSCPSNCYFRFYLGILSGGTDVNFEDIPPNFNFKRQFQIEDHEIDQKKITSVVQWSDSAGIHESKLTTILGKL